MNYHRVYSRAVDKRTGLRFDQSIALDGFYTRQEYPQHLRPVGFVDPESGKRLIFLTNHFTLPALTIAALYKQRWQVELFFKFILSRKSPFCRRFRKAIPALSPPH